MNGIINHYSILCLFIYLSIWLLGFPFLGDFWKSLFLEPHHLIVVVLLLILWESLKSWLGLCTRISTFWPPKDFRLKSLVLWTLWANRVLFTEYHGVTEKPLDYFRTLFLRLYNIAYIRIKLGHLNIVEKSWPNQGGLRNSKSTKNIRGHSPPSQQYQTKSIRI